MFPLKGPTGRGCSALRGGLGSRGGENTPRKLGFSGVLGTVGPRTGSPAASVLRGRGPPWPPWATEQGLQLDAPNHDGHHQTALSARVQGPAASSQGLQVPGAGCVSQQIC